VNQTTTSPVAALAASVWNPATGQFDPTRLRLAIVVREWTAEDFAKEADCGRTSVYKALQGKGVRDATAIAIFRTLAKREPRLPLAG
jgi:predicted transcriptional regulator